ncbi:hypothetical protein B0J14DRAFT_578372 [Halenospora varia]|nr:hypothetical protein B0J14DRAFT_578372 [Halenospora varia]
MGKTKTPKEFKIHVDQSCLTDSTDLGMAAERTASNETVVRHDSWSTDSHTEETPIDEHKDEMDEKEHEARERQIDRIEAQIQAAARAVVASIEQDAYGGNEESVLSMQTDESYDRDGTELTYDGTELSYDNGTEATYESEDDNHSQKETDLSASELSYESESELQSEVNKDIETTNIEQEDHTDAIEPEIAEEDNTKDEMEEPEAEKVAEQEEITDNKSVLDIQEDEDNTKEVSQNEEVEPESEVEVAEAAKPEAESQQELEAEAEPEPELEPEAELEPVFESEIESQSENDRAGDSSSQHDGDIDDDVFSSNSSRSNRSSLNSCDDLHHSDGPYSDKALTSPTVGEEAATKHEDQVISRVPSAASYMHPIPDSGQQTPSKVLHRPPFRSPSSVRAMQMSSPTPSIFSSPRSMKRHVPTVSRIGTPNSYSSKTRTPTRLKPRKADPLVLLHVTVMPLQWNYSHLMSSPDLPASLQNVKENWRLLQEKLGDTVLERGILLPHPQDSYEVLEERLLEALELPVRPRALILKCGHYMGPTDAEASSEDEDAFDAWKEGAPERKWCDICRRDVRLEYTGEEEGRKRFAVKIYASNGLMRAGAWAACWKEMERVDVEIGPYIEPNQHDDLEAFLLTKPVVISQSIHEAEDDGFEDEDTVEHVHIHEESEEPSNEEQPPTDEEQNHERTLGDEEPLIQQPQSEQSQEISDLEKELADHIEAEAAQNQRVMMEETHEVQFAQNQQAMVEEIRDEHFDRRDRRRSIDEYDLRKIMDHERLRGRFERDTQSAQPSRPSTRNSFRPQQQVNDESLSELLLAAAKVAMRDRRNVAIIALSLLVLILALRPSTPVPQNETKYSGASSAVPKIATESLQPATSIVWQTMTTTMEVVPGVSTKAAEVVIEKPRQVAADKAASSLRVAKPASKKTAKLAPKKAKKVPAKIVEVVQERVPEPVVEEELPVEEVEPVEQILNAQTRVGNEEVETLDETDEIQIDTIGEESDDVDVDIGSAVKEIVASTNLVTEEAPEATVISEEPEVTEEPIEEIEEQEERPADEL